MHISFRTLALGAFAAALTTTAHAGSGWEMTSFSTTPQNAPKLVSAIDEWMNGAGKDYPGMVVLQSHEADGDNPATHSVIALFESVAAQEKFWKDTQSDQARNEELTSLLNTFSENATVESTMRGSDVKSWGDTEGTDDQVWILHYLTASNAQGVVQAMDRWFSSGTGTEMPGQVHLSGIVAGGMGSPSHVVAIGYADQAEMESWSEKLQTSDDFANFMQELSQVSEYHGAILTTGVKTWSGAQSQESSGQ